MTDPNALLNIAKDALHFLYAAGAVFVGLVAALVTFAFRAGSSITRMDMKLDRLADDGVEMKAETRKVPRIEARLESVEDDVERLQRQSSNGHFGEE